MADVALPVRRSARSAPGYGRGGRSYRSKPPIPDELLGGAPLLSTNLNPHAPLPGYGYHSLQPSAPPPCMELLQLLEAGRYLETCQQLPMPDDEPPNVAEALVEMGHTDGAEASPSAAAAAEGIGTCASATAVPTPTAAAPGKLPFSLPPLPQQQPASDQCSAASLPAVAADGDPAGDESAAGVASAQAAVLALSLLGGTHGPVLHNSLALAAAADASCRSGGSSTGSGRSAGTQIRFGGGALPTQSSASSPPDPIALGCGGSTHLEAAADELARHACFAQHAQHAKQQQAWWQGAADTDPLQQLQQLLQQVQPQADHAQHAQQQQQQHMQQQQQWHGPPAQGPVQHAHSWQQQRWQHQLELLQGLRGALQPVNLDGEKARPAVGHDMPAVPLHKPPLATQAGAQHAKRQALASAAAAAAFSAERHEHGQQQGQPQQAVALQWPWAGAGLLQPQHPFHQLQQLQHACEPPPRQQQPAQGRQGSLAALVPTGRPSVRDAPSSQASPSDSLEENGTDASSDSGATAAAASAGDVERSSGGEGTGEGDGGRDSQGRGGGGQGKKRKVAPPRYRVKDVTLEILEKEGCFNMTQVDAARHLGFGSPTSIKAIMKRLGILKWPYRKKSTIGKMMDTMEEFVRRYCEAGEVDTVLGRCREAYRELEVYEKCTTGAPPPLAEELRALRQKVYKLKDQDKHGHSEESMKRCVTQLVEKILADADAARAT